MFTLGGPTAYSNALWWKDVNVDASETHFSYDLYFYLDDPNAPEALEFDVNQSFGGIRYTWGTECSFQNTGKWDVWDPKNEKWVTTSVPCKVVTANAWHHLTWQFEQSNGQVVYTGMQLDGVSGSVNQTFAAQPNWHSDETNVAFQMDGNFKQKPYKVWLDHVNLTTW